MAFPKRFRGSGPAQSGGIFAGLFVADPAALEKWKVQARVTPPVWPAVEFKHLETVKLEDELHNVVREGGKQGPWIARVRPQLVGALAGAEEGRIRAAAEAWADTDELKADSSDKPSPDDIDGLESAIRRMVGLAKVSLDTGRPMYLLMSL